MDIVRIVAQAPSAVGMLEMAETIHAYYGDRANGGSGYEVPWKVHV